MAQLSGEKKFPILQIIFMKPHDKTGTSERLNQMSFINCTNIYMKQNLLKVILICKQKNR